MFMIKAVFNVNIFFYTVFKYISSPAGRLAIYLALGFQCVCAASRVMEVGDYCNYWLLVYIVCLN